MSCTHALGRLLQDLMGNLDVSGDDGDDKFGDILTDFARICRQLVHGWVR